MLEMLANRPRHPLRELRDAGNVTAKELSKATGLSCTRISLCENGLEKFTPDEEKRLRAAIVTITKDRSRAVLSEARR